MAQLVDAYLLVTYTQCDHQLNVPEHRAQDIRWGSRGAGGSHTPAQKLGCAPQPGHRDGCWAHMRPLGWAELSSHSCTQPGLLCRCHEPCNFSKYLIFPVTYNVLTLYDEVDVRGLWHMLLINCAALHMSIFVTQAGPALCFLSEVRERGLA